VKSDVTFIGYVRRADGAKLYVEVSPDVPSASPIIHGRVYRLGQVGSFVRVPLGFLNLYGIVSMVGASEIMGVKESNQALPVGQRWLEVQLVGECYGNDRFQRGVSAFPTIDDEVHIVTESDLSVIYGVKSPSVIEVGVHAASESLTATLDLDKLVTRHAAILGSTGSGKSNTVAALLKAVPTNEYGNASIVVIDPHGEYRSALSGRARIFALGDPRSPLVIPYWALSFDELAWFLVDRRSASESLADIEFRDQVCQARKKSCQRLAAGKVDPMEVTADSPIPFDLRQLWIDLYEQEHATLRAKDDWKTKAYRKDADGKELRGDPATATAPEFEPPGAGSSSPFKSTRQKGLASYLAKIQGRLKDKHFSFLLNPAPYDGAKTDIHHLLDSWLGHEHTITVIDLGGLPSEVLDLVVGVVTRAIFEVMFWGRELDGLGRNRPVLLFFEEAHAYLGTGESTQFVAGYARKAVRKVFKEGRKYGIGAVVVSQRPSELDETILSQCGTFIALRQTSSEDQSRVRSALPETMAGLTNLLPALRTGEAIVVGEAVQIPCRVRFPLIEPRPASNDPEPSKRWQEKRCKKPGYGRAITAWRRQRTS
jgi:hypothetical protein